MQTERSDKETRDYVLDKGERIKQLEFEVDKLQKYRKESDVNTGAINAPFSHAEVEWRVQQCGTKQGGGIYAAIVPYINARAIMNRLDSSVGPHNWQVSYEVLEKGIVCTLSIKINGEWVSKQDGSGFTEIEEFKGGFSGALKRAAVTWGMGRYLYEMNRCFADISPDRKPGYEYAKTKEGQVYFWAPSKDALLQLDRAAKT